MSLTTPNTIDVTEWLSIATNPGRSQRARDEAASHVLAAFTQQQEGLGVLRRELEHARVQAAGLSAVVNSVRSVLLEYEQPAPPMPVPASPPRLSVVRSDS